MVTVHDEKTGTTHTTVKGTVKDILSTLNINSETVLVVRDNTVITLDKEVQDDDVLTLLSVISGG